MTDPENSSDDPSGQTPEEWNIPQPSCEGPGIPPLPSRRRRAFGIGISWFLILAAVAATQIPQFRNRPADRQNLTQDMSMQMMGKYVVGMKSLLGGAAPVELSIPQLKKTAESSNNHRKQLFLIPVLMELTDKEKTLAELERLTADPANDPDASAFLDLYRHGSDTLTPQQNRIIERYGWIGKLALSHDKAPSDPLRREVIRSAIRTFVAIVVFVIGAGFALLAGTVLFVIAVILRKKKILRARFSPPENPGPPLLEAFAIYLTGMIALPELFQRLLPKFTAAAILLALPAVVLALFWPFLRGSKWKEIRTAFGWHRGQGVFREMGAGILGYLAGLPLMLLGLIPALLLSQSTGTVPSHPIVNDISGNPIVLALIMGLACVWAPIVEETFFRGMLFGYLRRRRHWAISGIMTGFLFAVIHPQGWIAVPVLGAIGFTLCAIREWRGSIIASMTAHALNNGAVLLLAIFILT